MEAASKTLAAILDDARTSPLGAEIRRQFLKPDDAVGDAVDGLVVHLGGQIVQQQHRGVLLRKKVFEGEDLTAIAQRTLRQQANLGEGVEHDALRLGLLEGIEN